MDLDGVHFDQMDRMVLEACREAGGELRVVTCRRGQDDDAACALHRHALTMVERGFLEPVSLGGSRSTMQGAEQWATFRARAVALALLDILEKGEALERELAGLRPQSKPSRSKAARPAGVSSGRSAEKVTSPAENSSSSAN